MSKITAQQQAAIDSRGKIIVSASAGSGKTFVMIEKLVNAIADGADLDEVLAVTFTKKAAAQIKEKLRGALIKRMELSDGDTRARLKVQLSKIASSDISTIHSFCARLLRTYFYVLDVDGGFDIISSDDSAAKELISRAAENLFDRLYEENNPNFKLILKRYMKKRSDKTVKNLLTEAYSAVRSTAHYKDVLNGSRLLYTEEGFDGISYMYSAALTAKYERLFDAVCKFENTFPVTQKASVYATLFNEMKEAVNASASAGIFGEKPPLTVTRKPADAPEDKPAGELYKKFREGIAKRYNALNGDTEGRQTELEYFLKSGETAAAFSDLLLQFDAEYSAVKREENKLDYNDLEHLTLELLTNESVKKQINEKYKYVFVDEYQDVNPVQEEIISSLGQEVFLVGDVKQAIYGFRGSKSQFFTRKFKDFSCAGQALRLSNNFRSAGGILNFVNGLFSDIMREDTCGIDYADSSVMIGGGKYPEGEGEAKVLIFGKDEKEERQLKVYSVLDDSKEVKHSREGLGIVTLVGEILKGKHYDADKGCLVDTQAGDICILTRKNKGASVEGIVKALRDAGYSVAGVKEESIFAFPEVKKFLDILELIENSEQDIPLVTALLSPLGGFTEDELARVKIIYKDKKEYKQFRVCCRDYAARFYDGKAQKLNAFYKKLNRLRELSDILNVGELCDEILGEYGLGLEIGAEKVKNVIRLAEEGENLRLSEFLDKIKSGGEITAPAHSSSDSIKVMSMHASKGLEFPVVIISDITRTFKGMDYTEMPFDEQFGFAPKYHNDKELITRKTVLRRLVKLKSDAEELKNEFNLFYVACTRAMNKLYILAEEPKLYDPAAVTEARSYADIFDMEKTGYEELLPHSEFGAQTSRDRILGEVDEELKEAINKKFMAGYSHPSSVNLPVKSSASAILKADIGEEHFAVRTLFGGEGETSVQKGIAYHRFLQLCDFSKRSREEIESELARFADGGKIEKEQAELLDSAELAQILNMPVFDGLAGCELLREQEFLCRLPASELFENADEEDGVLVQGAIDLLVLTRSGYLIIDYKYSKKSADELVNHYKKQLQLYKKAVAKIKKVAENTIRTVLVNIRTKTLTEVQ